MEMTTDATENGCDDNSSSLIGCTEERRSILTEQNQAYEESLKIDRAKKQTREDALKEKLNNEVQKEEVRKARLARVPPEPSDTVNAVAVRVRHQIAGLQTRFFLRPCHMSLVYDWAGSLATEPEDFKLCDPSGVVQHPSSVLADPVTLNMVPSDDGTPCLSLSDDEVEFKGFGKPHDSTSDTVPDLACHELDENPHEPQDIPDTDTTG